MNDANDIEFFKETQTASTLIFDGKILHVYKDDITLPDGKPAMREYVRHIGAVCVIPLTENNEVICVRQYRYPTASVMLEIPAGKLDSRDEDPLEAALRELREETGARSARVTPLGVFYTSPAILDEKIHMFLAEELTFGETSPDEGEFVKVVKLPINELAEMIMRGEVPDGKTQAAVMKAVYLLEQRKKESKQ